MKNLSDEVWAALIALLAALVVAAINSLVTIRVSSSNRVIETVTKSRTEWVTELKKLFSEYLNHTKIYSIKRMPKDTLKWIENLNLISKRITIQLNPLSDKDAYILELLNNLNDIFEKIFIFDAINKETVKDSNGNNIINDNIKRYIDSYLEISTYLKDYLSEKNIKKSNCENGEYYIEAIKTIRYDFQFAFYSARILSELLEINIGIYFKCEWERIKFESRHSIRKYKFYKKFKKFKGEKIIEKRIENIKNKIIHIDKINKLGKIEEINKKIKENLKEICFL